MENVLSNIVINRLKIGEPQRIHIPFPAELGVYGDRSITDADLDAWVASHVAVPENMAIVGTCGGRAYRDKDLLPCLVVTVAPAKFSGITPIRNTWADGHGGVR